MNLHNVTCKECGYQSQYSEGDLSSRGEDCPICGAKNALRIAREIPEELQEGNLVAHIQEGMKEFGIEGLMEMIENPDTTPIEVRGHFLKVFKKHWPLLYPLMKKVNEKDLQ